MSSEHPLVSIVTPVYNGARFLEACLESSLAQTYPHWEHVIVDNGSTDATPEIVASYARLDGRFRPLRNETTVNALRNHNIAVRHVSPTSTYTKILHADDQLLPACVQKMVELAEAHPRMGMVGAYAHCGSSIVCGGLPTDQSYFAGGDAARRSLLRQAYPFWSPSCLLHRTRTIAERDQFYAETDLHADVQAAYEILEQWDFGFVHEPLTVIGTHAESRTSTLAKPTKRMLATNLDLLVSYGPIFLSEEEFREQMRRQLAQYYRELARSALELQSRSFWRLHRQALRNAGHPLRVWRLARSVMREVTTAPRASFRRVVRLKGSRRAQA